MEGTVQEIDLGDDMGCPVRCETEVNQWTVSAFPCERERTMTPKTSRDIPGSEPRKDKEREQQDAAVQDADKTGQSDWDNVHGDGGEIGLDEKK